MSGQLIEEFNFLMRNQIIFSWSSLPFLRKSPKDDQLSPTLVSRDNLGQGSNLEPTSQPMSYTTSPTTN